jgi:hypothetical protein
MILKFKGELPSLLKRMKKAKVGNVEFDFSEAITDFKNLAFQAGVSISGVSDVFSNKDITMFQEAPEWAFIKSWQNVEDLLIKSNYGRPKTSITRTIDELLKSSSINDDIANLLLKMYRLRNDIVHAKNPEVSRGEILEWLGLSRSIHDRLELQLSRAGLLKT